MAGREGGNKWNVVRNAVKSTNKLQRRIPRENFIGKVLRGTGLPEETMAGCVQEGLKRLHDLRARGHDDQDAVTFTVGDAEVTLEEHGADLFHDVRRACGVHEDEYQSCLTHTGSAPAGDELARSPTETNMRVVDLGDASGKSLSWFLVSSGMRFLLKTCSFGEARLLLECLPTYLDHLRQHKDSLLPRYYGLFLLRRGREQVMFLVMANAFAAYSKIRHRFDVKGSTLGREASAHERAKSKPILKDIDFLHNGPMLMAREECERFQATIAADANWLEARGLLDYSLLIGLAVKERAMSRHIVRALTLRPQLEGDPDLAYVCIIDILTEYTWQKKLEYWLVGCLGDISCVPPDKYAARFRAYIQHCFRADAFAGTTADFAEAYTRPRAGLGRRLGITCEVGKKDLQGLVVPCLLGAGLLLAYRRLR